MKLPVMYCWDKGPLGSVWAYGWWGGRDLDLLCIRPAIHDNDEARAYLSPVCSYRAEAVIAFFLKNALSVFDLNMRSLRTLARDRVSTPNELRDQ